MYNIYRTRLKTIFVLISTLKSWHRLIQQDHKRHMVGYQKERGLFRRVFVKEARMEKEPMMFSWLL